MEFSAAEIMVLVDTLNSSCNIINTNTIRLWAYDENQRRGVQKKLEALMNEIGVEIKVIE